MSMVQQLYDITLALKNHLQQIPVEEQQDEYISQIHQLLNRRQDLIQQLKGVYTEEERRLGKKIVEYNQEIAGLLQAFTENIQQRFRQVKQSQKVIQQYNRNQSQSIDGMFFDKRK